MSRKCDICEKGLLTGNNISHSHHKTKRKQKPNVHKTKIWDGKTKINVNVCTRCLKTGKVVKAI